MNKIIITIVILSSFSFGNLSTEQLLEFSKVSWGFNSYKQEQDLRYNNLFSELNISKDITNLKKIDEIKKYAYCQESFEAFLHEIKSLTNKEYAQIMSFYQSDLGSKLNERYKKIDPSKVEQQYKELEKKGDFSAKRISLIKSITKELNTVELKVQYKLSRLLTKRSFDEKNPKYSSKSLTEYINKYRLWAKEYEQKENMVIFKNFTIEELERVFEYAKTKGGKREMEVIFKGFGKAFMVQLYVCGKYFDNIKHMPNY